MLSLKSQAQSLNVAELQEFWTREGAWVIQQRQRISCEILDTPPAGSLCLGMYWPMSKSRTAN
jgi:hypothetical protein